MNGLLAEANRTGGEGDYSHLMCYNSDRHLSPEPEPCAMKITVEVNPEDLAVITEQVMKAAGPEAMSKIWIAIGNQIVGQMQAHMLSQIPEAFRPFRHAVAFDVRKKT